MDKSKDTTLEDHSNGSSMVSAPIELKFYDDEDQVIETHRRSRIPSYLLDMAISLQSQLGATEAGLQNTDALFDFIVEFYGKKFTREEVKQKTDLIECLSVLRSIIARAGALTLEFAKANPPGPSPKKR
jgi:hypothetical protein